MLSALLVCPMQLNFDRKGLKDHSYTNEELVSLFLNTGQNTYIGILYVRCSVHVYRQCLSIVKDPVKAQDCTHDIFVKLISILDSFSGRALFSTWLSKVTFNYCMDQFKVDNRRAETTLESYKNLKEAELYGTDTEDDSDLIAILIEAMADLTSEDKVLLMMKYCEDFSVRDIAHTFKITESAVKMRLLRTRNKLRIHCQQMLPIGS